MGKAYENPPLLKHQKSSVGEKRHHMDTMLNPGGGTGIIYKLHLRNVAFQSI